MDNQPRITVLGVYKIQFDESAVEDHLLTICPPYSEKTRNQVREMLDSTVLVEMLVNNRDERFYVFDFKQSVPETSWSWLYPVGLVCVWYLTADGEQPLEFVEDDTDDEDDVVPPLTFKTFRVALYFRGWEESKPLLSSYGELSCPGITTTTTRLSVLKRQASYFRGD